MSMRLKLTIGATEINYVNIHTYNLLSVLYKPYIVEVSKVRREISTEGSYKSSSFNVTIHDRDLYLRTLLLAGTELKGCAAVVYSDYFIFSGYIADYNIDSVEIFHFTIQDAITFFLRYNYPVGLLNTTTYPNMRADDIGKPYIYPYGVMSSAGYLEPHGAYDCPCIDTVNNMYYVSQLPIKSVDNVYREEEGNWVIVAGGDWHIEAAYAPVVVIHVTAKAPVPPAPGAGLEKIRVDVHGINGGVYGGAAAYTNPCDVRCHFLTNVVPIPLSAFDVTTWTTCNTACTAAGLRLAGVVNEVKAGTEWDTIMGFSSQTEIYWDKNALICIRLYTTPVGPADYEIRKYRDAIEYQPTIEHAISNNFSLKYAYNGSDYYASTFKLSGAGDKVREENLDFCWIKTAAEAVGTQLLKRYDAIRQRLSITMRNQSAIDLNKTIWLEDSSQINYQTYYVIESIEQDPISGLMDIEGFTD